MLTIRLFRIGRRNQPAFKIVVTDRRRSSTRGRFVEEVGFYNPLTKQRNLKGDRIKYWMSVGAKPSSTVHNMLVADNVVEGAKVAKHKASKKPAETPAEAPKPKEEAIEPKVEEPKQEEIPTAEPEKQEEKQEPKAEAVESKEETQEDKEKK